ncbi:MAG: Wzz/FepE/Etk N-terminal domain-containing protein [Chloroflexi bacterium]|nr:Wzz/FepE/Etk N-terminal domain-containing protein [Chloroflexota bacterium]
MQIKDYWQVISKRWWIFILVAAVAGASAYGFSKLQQPMYRSSAKLYVTPARPDYGVTLVISNLIRQYGFQLRSDRYINKINEQLRLDLAPGVLRSRIAVAATADNFAIQIDVDDPDPANAQRIAKALAQEFVVQHQIRMATVDPRDKIDVEILDDPEPAFLSQPKTKVNVTAGLVLGLLLACIIAFLLEYLDDTIKSAEDVERYVSLAAIGSIPTITVAEARRAR